MLSCMHSINAIFLYSHAVRYVYTAFNDVNNNYQDYIFRLLLS